MVANKRIPIGLTTQACVVNVKRVCVKTLETKDYLWLLNAPIDEWEKAVIVMALFGGEE